MVPYFADGRSGGINLSIIATKLIQDAGRFYETVAFDLLIDWKDIEKPIQTVVELDDSIIIVAFRRHCVNYTRLVRKLNGSVLKVVNFANQRSSQRNFGFCSEKKGCESV